MIPSVDTKSCSAVAAYAGAVFDRLHPASDPSLLTALFREVERAFTGRHPCYEASDLPYHSFEHTLETALCLVQILEGRHRAALEPGLSPREFALAVASVLLHDTGYLKIRGDQAGTGAKYTYCHVLRSCAFASACLPSVGGTPGEIKLVLSAIRCTDPKSNLAQISFPSPAGRFIGCALATADYLGQMAAPDYAARLVFLYQEFNESDDFLRVPAAQRKFSSAGDLVARTPGFWSGFVLPKLNGDFGEAYRFLADPYPDGPNAYLDAVEANMVSLRSQTARS